MGLWVEIIPGVMIMGGLFWGGTLGIQLYQKLVCGAVRKNLQLHLFRES